MYLVKVKVKSSFANLHNLFFVSHTRFGRFNSPIHPKEHESINQSIALLLTFYTPFNVFASTSQNEFQRLRLSGHLFPIFLPVSSHYVDDSSKKHNLWKRVKEVNKEKRERSEAVRTDLAKFRYFGTKLHKPWPLLEGLLST